MSQKGYPPNNDTPNFKSEEILLPTLQVRFQSPPALRPEQVGAAQVGPLHVVHQHLEAFGILAIAP